MADNKQIIELYTKLAQNPTKDFGWDKGLDNAKAHGYKQEWIDATPPEVWEYCAAVGNPFTYADIQEGDTVLDLGCGAGVDLMVSRLHVGKSGRVIGVDITPKMVETAQEHAKLAGFTNVEILENSFEAIALEDESVDVVISNGAINLTACKESVFTEIYRVLKPKGKISFADMIDISKEAECCNIEQNSCCASAGEEDWANCVAGTMRESELIELIQKASFENVTCTGMTHYTTSETTQGATFFATKIPAEKFRNSHWENIFQTKDYTQVLWHQNSPKKSLDFIRSFAKTDATIIDAGCGASLIVDNLLELGYKDITLLDTASTSLELVKKRINNLHVKYVCDDILTFETQKKFDIWHDRAVFHFLLSKKERQRYFEVLSNSLKENATAIIATFKVNGEIQCAGLDIIAYDYKKMLEELPKSLELIESEEYTHITPKESEQKYIYFIIKKRSQ
ncbi:class I SAM-dependent methyltransferase [Sulfurimonas autotrophica]|uniref:Methyltransferase type 11 n=1 Tax=Sulfurimonas autotrophica (strain ATCC BAA-671 / DSM 16294 / JCM 11897 / OK10) TaxID=563040 RepID=E0UQY9_SULAO|nr:class I SAM-dependent methyltransferase [Sulfurimonas autotrophica]ADN09945.1 Methyltransferase type 11 [Sulfurimonas autotrophica DSM 16294]